MGQEQSVASRTSRLTDVDRRIIRLAIPAFGALAAEPLYRLVDTAIVGRLGTPQLGGVAVAVGALSIVIAGSSFLAYGTTERVARRVGSDDPAGAARTGIQALWIAVAIGAIAGPLLAIGAEPLCRLLGADGDVLDFAIEYLQISAIGVPFVIAGVAAQGVQRGRSDYRTSLVVLVAANVVNVAIEPILVFGFDLGVAGAAWSTVVAQVLAGVALMWRTIPHVSGATTRRPDRGEIGALLSAGRHLLLRTGAMIAVFSGSTAVAARIDEPTLAAHQIGVTMFIFLALSLDALAVPSQTLVAEELGRGEGGAADVASRALRMSVVVGAILAAVVAASSPLLSRLFTDDPAVVSRATAALIVLGVMMIPGAIAFATDGSLIGAGDYRFLGRAALVYLVAVLPLAVLTLSVPSVGIVGVWVALFVWMSLRAMVNRHRAHSLLGSSLASS
ncbi:MAG: MATE family efflux transporter [Actinomycetota bacterium]